MLELPDDQVPGAALQHALRLADQILGHIGRGPTVGQDHAAPAANARRCRRRGGALAGGSAGPACGPREPFFNLTNLT